MKNPKDWCMDVTIFKDKLNEIHHALYPWTKGLNDVLFSEVSGPADGDWVIHYYLVCDGRLDPQEYTIPAEYMNLTYDVLKSIKESRLKQRQKEGELTPPEYKAVFGEGGSYTRGISLSGLHETPGWYKEIQDDADRKILEMLSTQTEREEP